MRIFRRRHLSTDDLATPGPLQEEVGAIVSTFNAGLGTENVAPAELPGEAEVELGAWNEITAIEGDGTLTINMGDDGDVPAGWVDTDLVTQIETVDCVLQLAASVRFADVSVLINGAPRQLALVVDGSFRSYSPQVAEWNEDATGLSSFLAVAAAIPLGPGLHDIRVKFRSILFNTNEADTELTWRRLILRECKR